MILQKQTTYKVVEINLTAKIIEVAAAGITEEIEITTPRIIIPAGHQRTEVDVVIVVEVAKDPEDAKIMEAEPW